jgi:hypothetical protein
MRGGLIEVDVVKFSNWWLKNVSFLNLMGLIKMWLDYCLFSIKFE